MVYARRLLWVLPAIPMLLGVALAGSLIVDFRERRPVAPVTGTWRDSPATGMVGASADARTSYRHWSWEMKPRMDAGDSQILQIVCEWQDERRSQGVAQFEVPATLPRPLTVRVTGPFDWSGDARQTADKGSPNPARWKWIFTAKEPGRKLILVQLPAIDPRAPAVDQVVVVLDRQFFVRGEFALPVEVVAPVDWVEFAVKLAGVLASLFGAGYLGRLLWRSEAA